MARRGQNGGPLRLRPSAGLKGATAIGLALATTAFAPYAAAGPKGGNVKAGAATISTAGGRTTINQQGQKVVIDWKSFDIDADEAVEFVQPGKGSIALNRVLGDLPTHIRGELLANGNVWIVNQHGITFHAGAAVDVGGLIATTADIADADFMAGNYRFDKPGAPGAKIINEGSITFGEAGLAAFVAPEVVNHGVIAGKMGKVVIAGQETFAVDLAGDGLWAFTMGDGASGAKATNTGKIHNPGGYILISAASAQGMVESQISIGGVVEAKSAEVKGGKIILSGDGAVEVTGTLDVSGAGSGETGGEIEITGDTVHLTPTAKLDARGEAGGGSVKVGGGYQGGGALETARRTLVSDGAEIDASVIGQVGDGGEVIVWADEISGFFGSIRATGGALGGDGGFAEVSGKQQLAFDGFVDLSAQNGLPGELLLDPTNIEIVAAAPGADDNELDGDESILFDDPAAGDLTISAAAVEAALDLNIVTLQATNDITVNAAVSSVSAYSLYMDAGNNIELNADLTIAGGLRLTANAAPYASGTGTIDASGGGALDSSFIVLSAGDDLALGEITASSYLTVTAGGAITQVVGQTLSVTGLSSFDADASDITLNEANDFQGAVSATGANVDLTDANSLELGEVSATTLDVVAGGAITQTATQKIAVMDVSDFDAGTSDITLAQANDFQGAVSANGANVDLTDENALELGAVSATALDVIAGGAIAQTATQTITVTDVSDFDAGTADITLTQANDFQGAVSATGANVDLTDDNALELGAVSATTLDVVAGGAITQTATQTVTVTDVSDFDAGTEDITLTQANDFQGAVSASGANVDLTDANALQLGAVSATTLDVVAGGAITQTATQTITVTDVSDIDAGVADITLTQANDFQGAVSASGANVDLADDNALEFGAVSATTLYVIAGGAITQTATQTITVADVSDIAAGTADITLAQANDFQGAVSASGANVDLTDANALELGAASVTTLDVIAGGAITQTATQTITVTDVSDFDAGTADITLTQANDFQGAVSATGANVDLTDDNSLELGVVYATTLDVVAGGAITQTATQTVTVTGASDFEAGTADITLTQANEFDGVVDANGAAISLTDADSIQLGAITATGALTVIAADAISDMAGSRISAGATTLTSTNYDAIVLDNTAESDLHILGEVRVDGGAATINEYDRVTLGVSTVRGDLTVRADDLDVAGAVSVASGTGTVIIKTHGGQLGLGDATGTGVYGETNNITNADVAYLSAGALRFEADTTGASLQTDNFDSGAAISRVEIDVDAVTFGVAGGTETFQNDLAIEVNTYVRQGAGGTLLVNGETSFAADGLEVTLANAGNDFGGSVSGDTGATTLTDLGALDLGGLNAGSLTITAGGDVTDSAANTVSGAADITALGQNVVLDEANDFQGVVDVAAQAVSLTDANALELGDIDAGGDLTVNARSITQGDRAADEAIEVAGAANLTATTTITLADADNDFGGPVSLSGSDVQIANADETELADVSVATLDVTAGGAITQTATQTITVTDVSDFDAGTADITLTQANDFQGAVSATGGNVDLTDDNALELGAVSATTLDVIAGGAITQTATQTITVTDVSDFDAGTADITLTQANDFQGAVSATGANVNLTDDNAIELGAVSATTLDVIAGGTITQTATQTITVTDVSDFDAGTADITLTQTNDFQGAVSASGANVDLTDANALELGAISATTLDIVAGGAITQTATQTITVTDVSDIDAGTSDITLTEANDFQGAVSATGANIDLTDANAILLGAISATSLDVIAGGAITQTATQTINVTGLSSFNAAGANVTLIEGNDFQDAVDASGEAIVITDTDGVTLGAITATGSLTVNAGGAIDQTADGVSAQGVTTLETTDTSDITLTAAANDFQDDVTFSGQTVAITDTNALSVDNSDASGDATFTAGGDLSISGVSTAALTGVSDGTIGLDNALSTVITLGGAGTTSGAAVRADGSVTVMNVDANELRAASEISVSIENARTSGAVYLNAPEVDLTFVQVGAFQTGGDIDLNTFLGANLETLTFERVAFVGNASVAAMQEVRLGHVSSTGALNITTTAADGGVRIRDDADIDFANAGETGFSVETRGGTTDITGLDAFADLLNIGGASTFDAGAGEVILTRGRRADDSYAQAEFGGAVSVTASRAALEDATSLQLGEVTVTGDFAVRINADNTNAAAESLTQTGAAMQVGGAFGVITGVGDTDRSNVTLNGASNDLYQVNAVAAELALTETNGLSLSGSELTGGLTVSSGGALNLTDVTAQTIDVTGASIYSARLAATDASASVVFSANGSGGVTLYDVSAGGGGADIDAAAGAIMVTYAVLGDFDFDAGGDLTLTNTSLGSATGVSSGQAITLSNVLVGGAAFDAAAGASLAAVRSSGALTLTAEGDIALGALSAAAIDATSNGGSIAISDNASNEANPADIVVEASTGGAIGFGVPGSDARVVDNAAAGAVDGAVTDAFTSQLLIAGDAAFNADQDVILPHEADPGGLTNDFQGAVEIVAGGDAAIEDANALTLSGSVDGRLAARTDAGAIDQSGALTVGGDAAFIAGGDADVTLTNAANDFATISVAAANASLVDVNDITVADSRVAGALDVSSGAGAVTMSDVDADAALSIDAVSAVSLTRVSAASAEVESQTASVTALDLNIAGSTDVNAETTLSMTDAILGATTLEAGATATLTRVFASTLNAETGGVDITDAIVDGQTILTSNGAVSATRFRSGVLTADAAGSTASFNQARIDGALTLSAGETDLTDVEVTGAADLTTGAVTATRMLSDGDFSMAAAGDVMVTDLKAATVAIASEGALTASDVSTADLTISRADNGAALQNAEATAASLTTGGALQVDNLRASSLTANAAGEATITGANIAGDASLIADGDLSIGAVQVDGALVATSTSGEVGTVVRETTLAAFTVEAPGAASISTFTADGAGGATIGFDAPLTPVDGRVTETLAAVGDATAGAIGGQRADTIVAADEVANTLTVVGDTSAEAGADLVLTGDVDLQGALDLNVGGDVAISDDNDLTISAVIGGALLIEAGGDVSNVGGPLSVGEDLFIDAGGDITLDDAANDIGGAIGANGENITIFEAGTVRLGPINAGGELFVMAGAGGTEGDAAIIQESAVTVSGADAQRTEIGPIRVGGDAFFTTGLARTDSLGSVSDAERELTLDNRANQFDGKIAATRIAGDLTIIEESNDALSGADAGALGELRIGALEFGGDATIVTTDAVIFEGRMTALQDSDGAPQRFTPNTAQSPVGQSNVRLGDIRPDRLRIYIPDGNTLTVDTTGGGRTGGADVRFDRQIDGQATANAVSTGDRDGEGALEIAAGTRGDVIFRDFVGAQNPLGDVTIAGANLHLGTTFADRTSLTPATPRTRFLIDPAAPADIFLAHNLTVTLPGAILLDLPPGLRQTFIDEDEYFGVNLAGFSYQGADGDALDAIDIFGLLDNTRARIAGLDPDGERDPDFQFNDCEIRDPQDCSTIPIPSVPNMVLVTTPALLDVQTEDLLELFGSFGNEELWDVPQSYYRELGGEAFDAPEECPEGDKACEEGS